MSLTVAAPLAYVRTPAGTVQLHKGEPVPAEADGAQVGRLLERGVLIEKPKSRQQHGDSGNDES